MTDAVAAPRTTLDRAGFSNVLVCPLVERGATSAMRRLAATLTADASVDVVAVLEQPTRIQRFLHGADHVEAMLEVGHRDAARRLRRCVDQLRDGHRAVDHTIEVGHAALSLVGRAVAARHDLVVLVGDEQSDHALIRRIMRRSPCPVWVARPTRHRHPNVLVAVDADPDQRLLNTRLLQTAGILAGAEGTLHVVNAWELYGESSMRSSAFIHVEPEEIERRRREVRLGHERAVTELVDGRDDRARWQIHVEHGPAVGVVRDAVASHRIDTLVIGTVARSGISGAVMGNTAEQLVDDVTCSVVAVKPPEFG